jgi:isatin hydrolase
MNAPFAGSQLVDLSLVVAEDRPCWWPAHMPYQQKTFNYFESRPDDVQPVLSRAGAYHTRVLYIDEHTGTHFDAPTHFIPPPGSELPNAGPMGEVWVEDVPLDQLMGPAAVIDVSALPDVEPGMSPVIDPSLVRDWESAHGELAAGEVVLFSSGWDERYKPMPDGSAYAEDVLVHRTSAGWPAPGVEVMQLLLERGVRCVGTDGPTMGAAHDGVPVHVAGLAGGAVFVEGLAHLSALPPRGAWFCFAPVKLAHGTGAPGRAFAFVQAGGPSS